MPQKCHTPENQQSEKDPAIQLINSTYARHVEQIKTEALRERGWSKVETKPAELKDFVEAVRAMRKAQKLYSNPKTRNQSILTEAKRLETAVDFRLLELDLLFSGSAAEAPGTPGLPPAHG